MNTYPLPENICAVITTFCPDNGFSERVARVNKQVGFIVIVDDGNCNENISKLNKWFKDEKKILLHHNMNNVGIATSLNTGISIAKDNGYRWILTVDDDSFVRTDLVERLIDGLKNIKINKPIGIIGMIWREFNSEAKPIIRNATYSEKRGIITSCSLFSTRTYDRVGPFRDEFYIDFVDFEYCHRVKKHGLMVIELNELGFEHSVGKSRILNLLGRDIIIKDHEVFRVYYWFRNSMVLAIEFLKNDPTYSFILLAGEVKRAIKILLFERSKIAKMIQAFNGLKDGLARNLGKK